MKKKILVIEYEKATRENLLIFLKSEGFNAIGAENGKIGVNLAIENVPDLIICDLLMPEMDGYDVLSGLQQNPKTMTIPFIFLIDINEQDFLTKNQLFTQEDYLQKPINNEQLRRAIANKLSQPEAYLQKSSDEYEWELDQLKKRMETLTEYSRAKDNLLVNFCQNLKQSFSFLSKEIKFLKKLNLSQEQNDCIDRIQKEFLRISTLVNQVSELQRIITPENYTLLEQFFKSEK
jgi:response regulator RpfG family c-di-GMP phosphodiesterase